MLISVCGTCVRVCACAHARSTYMCVYMYSTYMYVCVYTHATYRNFADVTNSVQKWIIEFRIVASKEMTCMHVVRCVWMREGEMKDVHMLHTTKIYYIQVGELTVLTECVYRLRKLKKKGEIQLPA